ncbi:hypothetical protein D514_0110325 [Microbacterium sp. UCD-TDU]|nr:hypothetical protein D514_0110325 [Microbacterium sp. UCD-TDU]
MLRCSSSAAEDMADSPGCCSVPSVPRARPTPAVQCSSSTHRCGIPPHPKPPGSPLRQDGPERRGREKREGPRCPSRAGPAPSFSEWPSPVQATSPSFSQNARLWRMNHAAVGLWSYDESCSRPSRELYCELHARTRRMATPRPDNEERDECTACSWSTITRSCAAASPDSSTRTPI